MQLEVELVSVQFLFLTNPKIYKRGLIIIKNIQKGGGGPPSTIVTALKVLNRATAKKTKHQS